jgi:hypothetical protein
MGDIDFRRSRYGSPLFTFLVSDSVLVFLMSRCIFSLFV